LDYIKAHAAKLEASAAIAISMNKEYGLMGTAGPAFIHYLVSRKISAKQADEFLSVLFTGRGNGWESIEPLRKALTKDLRSIRKMPAALKITSMMKAYVAWVNQETPKQAWTLRGDDLPRI
jgi:hypothetical protein